MVPGEKYDIGKERLGMRVLFVSLHFFWCVLTRSDYELTWMPVQSRGLDREERWEQSGADKSVLGSPCSHRGTSSRVPVAVLASPVGLCLCWPTSDAPMLLYSQTHTFVWATSSCTCESSRLLRVHTLHKTIPVYMHRYKPIHMCALCIQAQVHICAHLCCK